MTDRRHRFEVGERVRVEASTTAGDIVVVGGTTGVVEVTVSGSGADDYLIEQAGDVVTVTPSRRFIRSHTVDVMIQVPEQASLELATAAGDVTINRAVDDVEVKVASGDIRSDDVQGSARIKTAAGDVRLGDVGGDVDVKSASGSVRIGAVGGDFTVTSASGHIQVDRIGQSARLKSASGHIEIGAFEGTDCSVQTLSGGIKLGIPPRRLIELNLYTLSGGFRNHLPEGDGSEPEKTITLRLKTVSGDVTLRGA